MPIYDYRCAGCGAQFELLVRRERGLVTSRVLAGTIRRTGDDERDAAWTRIKAAAKKQAPVTRVTHTTVSSSTLPFTGLDLALLVIGGLMLLVVGMVLRRAVRRTT